MTTIFILGLETELFDTEFFGFAIRVLPVLAALAFASAILLLFSRRRSRQNGGSHPHRGIRIARIMGTLTTVLILVFVVMAIFTIAG